MRRRDQRDEPIPRGSRKQKPKPARPSPRRPSELERIEADIARQEEAVAELERRLSADWADIEALAAHRQARDELQALLSRWETLFEQAGA